MSLATVLKAHAERQLATFTQENPGTVSINGTSYSKCVVIAQRGMVKDARGGFKQGQTLAIQIAYARIPAATLIDATRGVNKRLEVTHLGKSYRLSESGVAHDPHYTTWFLTAEEAVA
jgi:hypothetical protein